MICKIVILVALIYCVNAQVFSFGKCPTVQLKEDFDLNEYLGEWYEIERFFDFFQRKGGDCCKANYTLKSDGHIKVYNRGVTKTGEVVSATGDAYCPDPVNNKPKLAVRFSDSQPYGDYWVVNTDYESFTIVYSCSEHLWGLFHFELCWVLSRTPALDQTTVTRAENLLEKYGVDTSNFKKTKQTDCPNI